MVRLTTRLFTSIVLACAFASAAAAEERRVAAIDPEGIQRLQAETGGAARVSVSSATGAVASSPKRSAAENQDRQSEWFCIARSLARPGVCVYRFGPCGTRSGLMRTSRP